MLISKDDRLSFEKSKPGRRGAIFTQARCGSEPAGKHFPPALLRQKSAAFPEMTEPDIVRHFVNLSRKNFSIDTHFYPLGSCSMKYNPKINETVAAMDEFAFVHPLQPAETMQGYLEVLHLLQASLSEITGMDYFSLQPAAGAHGEMTGLMLVHAHHQAKGEVHRRKVLVPDSSHGTNPATAAFVGYEVQQVKSNARGRVDIEDLKRHLDETVACLMLTNPNTLGLFEEDILEIKKLVHDAGGLLYYDGANFNALLGIARPGDMGFDIVHLNLHKTFSTPHGGGGPGAGPVGVKKFLKPYLPLPWIREANGRYELIERSEQSIGRMKSFFGNAGILLRAYVYIRSLGLEGLKKISEDAIINANYLKEKLKKIFPVAVDEPCMHEFVLMLKNVRDQGLHVGDVGKRLLDYGFHAPTVSFPLIVPEALMVEPTESETRETLDQFVEALTKIHEEIKNDPEKVKSAPHSLPIRRPDEVMAARKPILTYRAKNEKVDSPAVMST